jgi:hypothetical protein
MILHCKMTETGDKFDVPIANADNSVCTSADDWAKIQIYIDELEDLARVRCQQ